MKLSKDKRDRIILVVIMTLAVSFGIYQLVIKSRSTRTAAQRIELDRQQDLLTQAKDWIERAQAVEREMVEATAAVAVLERGMGAPADPYAWSYQLLDQAAQGHKVEVVEVTRPALGPVRLLPEFPYQAAAFSVSGRAYYHDFGLFIADFENRFPYFRIENVELGRRTSPSEQQLVGAERELLAFKMDIVALIKPSSN